MSLWPFRKRRGAKLKSDGAQPVPARGKQPAAVPVPARPQSRQQQNPSAGPVQARGLTRKLSKRQSQRRKPGKPLALEPEVKEKDFGASPLAPISPTSPMDTTIFDGRPDTAGSVEDITA